MKLGLFDIMQLDPTRNETIQQMYARRLDDLALADGVGFDAAFIAERHFLPNYATPSAVTWIAAASQRTTRMRIGSLGFTLPIKAPVQLAEDLAVLDHLSGARLEVGFGLGHRVEELEALGYDPNQRIPMFQRRLAIVRALWTGGKITVEQDDVIARSLAIHPIPMQQPHPPLWFAGSDAAAAHWMGANGLGLAIGFKPTSSLIATVAAFKAGTAMMPDELRQESSLGRVMCMRNIYVADSDDQALDEIADDLVRLQELVEGSQGEGGRADRRTAARASAEQMIRNEVMIAGSVDTVTRAMLIAGEQLGVDTFLAGVYAMGLDDERIRRSLRLLAGPVRDVLADVPGQAMAPTRIV
jgi:alkanesulfonate monooxygenase SsuD/methylene tetrahydromethanopterin reductase-like flavin-dependent oxidoreductase (luciferase family)